MRKLALSLVATFALALAITGSTASPAAAYGNDAIYQIEFSLNCTDRNSTFCTQVVGLGGLWGWIAVGNDGFADVEATFCGHGFLLAPHGGAGHLSADIPWSYTSTQGEFPWVDPNGQYVSIGGGPGAFVFPATAGHYYFTMGPGINATAQIVKIPNR
ncbi:MAG: hypothetical protein E6I44_14290 [Chloroflexi bacterium]|nr:MAG: hypothetical protein E6I44_14290 [Chloroflexota bacterium]